MPINKAGRNDPCPCGSGKKYKHCCLTAQEATVSPEAYLWRRIRRAIEGLPGDLLNFSNTHYGPAGLHEAWDEFTRWDGTPFDPRSPHIPLFMPWFYYGWTPDPQDTAVPKVAQKGQTLGAVYLQCKGKYLDPLRAQYLEKCCEAAFSFYDILAVRPGSGFVLRNIFTAEEIEVTERAGSQNAQAGDILFAQVIRFDALAMIEACAPIAFPPIEKAPMLALRKKMLRGKRSLTQAELKGWDLELIEIYYTIAQRLLNPQLPQLQNTDGDPMLFHRLIYAIESPRVAFDALKHLCITADETELLADAESDAAGVLRKIEFSWQKPGNAKNKSWDNTVLGTIIIDGGKLSIEVNSENRAQAARAQMEQLLPTQARYQTTVIESAQAMLARAEQEGAPRQSKETEDLNALPEVQAHLAQMLREYYRNWLHEKIPALNNKTPLQAVKSKDGREMVEALLLQIERYGQNQQPPLEPAIIAELRATLGLE